MSGSSCQFGCSSCQAPLVSSGALHIRAMTRASRVGSSEYLYISRNVLGARYTLRHPLARMTRSIPQPGLSWSEVYPRRRDGILTTLPLLTVVLMSGAFPFHSLQQSTCGTFPFYSHLLSLTLSLVSAWPLVNMLRPSGQPINELAFTHHLIILCELFSASHLQIWGCSAQVVECS